MQREKPQDGMVKPSAHRIHRALVKQSRGDKGPKECTEIAGDPFPGVSSENEKRLSQHLMPALGPEDVHRVGTPWVVHDGGPGGGGAVEAADGDGCDEVVDHVEADHDGGAGHGVDECGDGVALDRGEGGVEDGASGGGADAGE